VMLSTRRGFLGAATAGVAAPRLLAGAPAAAAVAGFEAEPVVVREGRAIAAAAAGRRVWLLVAHSWHRSIAITEPTGRRVRVVDVGGRPVDVAIAPGGRLGAVTTGFWDEPGLALLDLTTGAVIGRLDVGPAPGALAFSRDGHTLVVAGGEQEGTIQVIDVRRRRIRRSVVAGLVPRGLALTADGRAWVALNAQDRLARVNLERGRVERTVPTPALPHALALSPDGSRALVTHGGLDSRHVSEIDLHGRTVKRHAAGPLPSGVAWARGGRRLVAIGGAAYVVELGRSRRHAVAPAPRGIALVGRRFFTASALTAEISEGHA
jgi:DNA-binding beta-propeller fold protein YncE